MITKNYDKHNDVLEEKWVLNGGIENPCINFFVLDEKIHKISVEEEIIQCERDLMC